RTLRDLVQQLDAFLVVNPQDVVLRIQLLTALRSLGATTSLAQPEAAEEHLLRSQQLCEQLLNEGGNDDQVLLDAARVQQALADLYYKRGQLLPAEHAIQRSIGDYERLMSDSPDSEAHLSLMTGALTTQGMV